MSYHEPLSIGVGGLISNAQGRILLVERVKDPNVWTLPSGYVESGETIYQTLRRELREETNIIIKPFGIIGLRQRITEREHNNFWVLIRADYISGEPKPDGVEIFRVSFFDLEKTPAMKLTPVTQLVLAAVQNEDTQELQLQSKLSREDYLFFC